MKKLRYLLLTVVVVAGCAKKAPFHAQYEALIRDAATPRERHLYALEYQVMCWAEEGRIDKHLVVADGIQEPEAWLLATAYVGERVGLCISKDIPERIDGRWEIRVAVGRGGKESVLVCIDARSGRITCDGHQTIDDPKTLLRTYEARFKNT